jgi:RNA polymerase sigma factor (sigma-70 family)
MTDETATDQSLMQRFADGDADAFECLYRRHELRVWRYLERAVRDRAVADDLMQDVWFAVAREAPRYRPTARFTTWLFTLAHNRMIDWFRASRPQVRLDDTDEDGAQAVALTDSRPGPLENVSAGQDAAAVLEAVSRLPPLQQEAFVLHADGGLSVEEIAEVTGSSFETTKSRLRYARARLRQLLAEYA